MNMQSFLQDTANVQYLETLLNTMTIMSNVSTSTLTEKNINDYHKEFSSIDIKISVNENSVIISSEHSRGNSFINELLEESNNNNNNNNNSASIEIEALFEAICDYFINAKFNIIDIEHIFIIATCDYRNCHIFDKIAPLLTNNIYANYFGKVIGNGIYLSLSEPDRKDNFEIVYSDIEDSVRILFDIFAFNDYDAKNSVEKYMHDFLRHKCYVHHNGIDEKYCKFFFMSIANEIYNYLGIKKNSQQLHLSALYNLQDLNFVKYTELYIPPRDKAPKVIGEIARAFQHIIYRLLNDGDCPVYNSPTNLSLYNLTVLLNKYCSDECEEYSNLETVDIDSFLKTLNIDVSLIHNSLMHAVRSNYLHRINLTCANDLSEACDGIKDSTSAIIVIQFASFFNWLFINHKDKIDELCNTNNKYDTRKEIIWL